MPVATPAQIQSMIAKDQPTPIPERVMKEFADLQDLLRKRDTGADLYEYETVPGFFRQSDPTLVKFSPQQTLDAELGLLETDDDRWGMFKDEIAELNKNAPKGTCYKVLFCMRHGQGEHNLVMTNEDPESWKATYAEKKGAVDPELTELGKTQGKAIAAAWKNILDQGAPKPEKFLVSPLVRAIETMQLVYKDVMGEGTRPVVIEDLREVLFGNTWDQRRSKSELAERFPKLDFEEGFAEKDPLKEILRDANWNEGNADRLQQVSKLMTDLVKTCPETYIAITGHRRCLTALFALLRHRDICLAQGEIIPAVIKITEKQISKVKTD